MDQFSLPTMDHKLNLKVTEMEVTPLQDVEMTAFVRMEGDLIKDEQSVRLPLVDAKGSSKIFNCNEDINHFLVESVKPGSLNEIEVIWPKKFLDEKTSKDKKVGDEKTGGEKEAGDPLSPMEESPSSKKVGNVLIPMEELLRNKAGGNEHSGNYVLRGASAEAKVMLSLPVKIADFIMPNGSDCAADGATYSTYQHSPPQPITGYLPPPGSPAYTHGAYGPYILAYSLNPYLAPDVYPISHYNNFYPQVYLPYPFNNSQIQGYTSFHGYSHAPQQPTSTLGWVRTGLEMVHDCLLLAGVLQGGPILDGFGGEDFGGA